MYEKKASGELFISILLAIIIIIISGVVVVQGDLTTYITAPMAMVGNGLFANDFSVQEFLRPNPQTFSDLISALFLVLGIPWQTFALAAYLFQAAVFAAGIIAISKHICQGKNYWLMSSLLLLLSFYAVSGFRIGSNFIWYDSFYYAQSGFAAGVWGFYLSLKKKWIGAFSVFSMATLLHFTAGAYCAAFVLPFLLYDVIKNRRFRQLWAIAIWAGVCVGIFIMMYLAGTTSTGLLSNSEFINIHCYLRHPHHHVPTSWDRFEWINFIFYIAGVFVALKAILRDDPQKRFLMSLFYTSTALSALILCANVLFVEIIPLSFIAKIQPARCLFIYRFFLAGMLAYTSVKLYRKKAYLMAASLILAACLPEIGLKTYSGILTFFCSAGLLLYTLGEKRSSQMLKTSGILCSIMTSIIVLLIPFGAILNLLVIGTIIGLMMVISLADAYFEASGFLQKSAAILAVLIVTACVYLIPLVDISGRFEKISLRPVMERYNSGISGAVLDIAEQFKEKTDKDALFLGDPYDLDTSFFRLYSERSSVIAFKNMPFTDEGMLEWADRLEKIGAISMDEGAGHYIKNEKAFSQLSPRDTIEYAESYDAGYILLNNGTNAIDEYLDIGCSVLVENNEWTVMEISP